MNANLKIHFDKSRLEPLYGLAVLILLVLIIETLVRLRLVSTWVLPPPHEVGYAIWELLRTGILESALLPTMMAVAGCVVLVVGFGLLIGYILYRYPLLGRAYENLLSNLFAVPMVLLFPIFLVIFGRSYLAIIACAFLHCILPVIIYTREALLTVPAIFLNVGKVFRFSERDMFWKIMLPQALPTIFLGIRISVIYVLVYIVGIEFLISFGGLGGLIADMYMRFEVPKTFAAIFFVIVLSASFDFALRGIEGWIRRGYRQG